MSRKAVKLLFFGVPIRRRNVFLLTLCAMIFSVPALSCALLAWGEKMLIGQRLYYAAPSVLTVGVMLVGWRLIRENSLFLYLEEGQFIWPGAFLGIIVSTAGAALAAMNLFPHRASNVDFAVSGTFGLLLGLPIILRLFSLRELPRRRAALREPAVPPPATPAEQLPEN